MTPLCSRTGLFGPVPKGRWLLSWTNRRYGRNLLSLIRTKLEERRSGEWKHPGSPRPKKVRSTQYAAKVMFIVADDIDVTILHHAVPLRQTVNAVYYCTFMQHHLRRALRRKRRHLVIHNPIFLHDNARSHTAAAVTVLLRSWQWEILEHPPYSSDMSPCDYDLFVKVKEPRRRTRHNTRDELIRAIGRSVRNINKDGRVDGVRLLPNIWQKVINKEVTILKVHT